MSLEINNLNLTLSNKKILSNINLKIEHGKIIGVIGPNGSGKSSLIKSISGIYNYNGKIVINNKELRSMGPVKLANCRAIMSQSQNIVFDFNCREIIEMGVLPNRGKKNEQEKINELVKTCKIDHLLERKINTLSGGEQKRVHFARTLMQYYTMHAVHKFIILDEPLANLDMKFKLEILKILKNLLNEKVCVIIALHDLNIAYNFTDKIILLNEGEVFKYDKTDVVFTEKSLSEVYQTEITINKKKKRINYF